MKRAFTLIELLVVIAIIAILAAILFPVFAQAKEAAKKTADLSNMKQHVLSAIMYSGDSDDMAPLWMYYGSDFNVSTSGDRSWGNLVFPYSKADDLSKTPNSPFSVQSRKYNPNFPSPNSVPAALKTTQEQYNLGWLTDYGYNYINFTGFGLSNGNLVFTPISLTTPASPANTLLLITGDFNRDASGGIADGGQLPIDEPCLYDSSFNGLWAGNLYYYYGGWNPSQPNSWNVFGGAWPYYGGTNKTATGGARASVGYADGHAKTLTISQVADGCNVKDGSVGTAYDLNRYIWDTKQ